MGNTTLGQVILGSIFFLKKKKKKEGRKKKVTDCETASQPESSGPLWSLHQFLLWLPLMMEV